MRLFCQSSRRHPRYRALCTIPLVLGSRTLCARQACFMQERTDQRDTTYSDGRWQNKQLTGVCERRRIRPFEKSFIIHIRGSDPVRCVVAVARADQSTNFIVSNVYACIYRIVTVDFLAWIRFWVVQRGNTTTFTRKTGRRRLLF